MKKGKAHVFRSTKIQDRFLFFFLFSPFLHFDTLPEHRGSRRRCILPFRFISKIDGEKTGLASKMSSTAIPKTVHAARNALKGAHEAFRVFVKRRESTQKTSRAGNWFSGGRSTPRACHDAGMPVLNEAHTRASCFFYKR